MAEPHVPGAVLPYASLMRAGADAAATGRILGTCLVHPALVAVAVAVAVGVVAVAVVGAVVGSTRATAWPSPMRVRGPGSESRPP
ncbi:hypothetical protein ACFY5C_34690 [Streptomyces sp. NPDC012935]|uniref:hypothetical protein n=1 Tax=Streptomyces sp. NPDC012935 TaxID=3364857 RepID=UPI0036937A94